MSDNGKAYIYIMTNKSFEGHDWVKIGYATDVEKRRKQLSTTNLPYKYEIYATYEIPRTDHFGDRVLHNIITSLNPSLRLSPSREFFEMTPKQARGLLLGMAIIHNRENYITDYENGKPKTKKNIDEKTGRNISSCDELDKIDNSSINVYCKNKRGADAKGIYNKEGLFVLLAGSKIAPEVTNSLQAYNVEYRKELIDSGDIVNFIVMRDISIASPSRASCLVLGKSSNGNDDWKTEDGTSLGKLINK